MIIFVLILIVISVVVLGPLFLLAGGKLLKVENLRFRKALTVNLWMVLCGFGLLVVGVLLQFIGADRFVVAVLLLLGSLVVGVWLVRRKFEVRLLRSIGVYAIFAVLSLLAGWFVHTFITATAWIPPTARSMEPAILVGDHVFINKFIYRVREPERGEFLVFKFPPEPRKVFVKRLVGLPGETVEIRDGKIFIDGTLVKLLSGDGKGEDYGPEEIPAGSYFVLGEDLDNSYDSRYWGFVPGSHVVGRTDAVYWSMDPDTRSIRWNRIFKSFY